MARTNFMGLVKLELNQPTAIKLLGIALLLALVGVAVNDYIASLQPYYFLDDKATQPSAQPTAKAARQGFSPPMP